MKRYWKRNKLILAVTLLLCTAAALMTTFVSLLLQQVTDTAVSGDMALFKKLLLFAVSYMIMLCLMNYFGSLASKLLVQRMTRQIRSDVYEGVMHQYPGEFYKTNTADYISSLINDVKIIEENYILPLLQSIEVIVMFVSTLVLLLALSPAVTGILLVTLLLMFAVPALMGKLLEKRQDAVSRQLAKFTEKTKDILSGFEVIRSYQLLSNMRVKFEEENKRTADCKFAADKVTALNEGLSDTLSYLCVVVVIFTSAFFVIKGSITMGTLMALLQLSGSFLTPVLLIMENLPKIRSVKPIVQRLCGLADTEIEAEQGKVPSFDREIAVSDLSFSYDGSLNALNHISLRFVKGKKYAVVGHSGCGKSTLIKVLSGYYKDYQGEIFYDEDPLSLLDTKNLGSILSILHQSVYLFNDTVRNNIALEGDFDKATWEQALEASGVSQFMALLEKGLDSPVGENGNRLSGGQRQRVALARALIRKAKVIILDEGTSALDPKTALEIESTLLTRQDLTLITITHSLNPALLSQYNQVIYMEDGSVKDMAAYEQLLENNPSFRNFCGV